MNRRERKEDIPTTQKPVKVFACCLQFTTICCRCQNREIQFGKSTGLALEQQSVCRANCGNMPGKRDGHRTVFRNNYPSAKHDTTRHIAVHIRRWSYPIKWVKTASVGIVKH